MADAFERRDENARRDRAEAREIARDKATAEERRQRQIDRELNRKRDAYNHQQKVETDARAATEREDSQILDGFMGGQYADDVDGLLDDWNQGLDGLRDPQELQDQLNERDDRAEGELAELGMSEAGVARWRRERAAARATLMKDPDTRYRAALVAQAKQANAGAMERITRQENAARLVLADPTSTDEELKSANSVLEQAAQWRVRETLRTGVNPTALIDAGIGESVGNDRLTLKKRVVNEYRDGGDWRQYLIDFGNGKSDLSDYVTVTDPDIEAIYQEMTTLSQNDSVAERAALNLAETKNKIQSEDRGDMALIAAAHGADPDDLARELARTDPAAHRHFVESRTFLAVKGSERRKVEWEVLRLTPEYAKRRTFIRHELTTGDENQKSGAVQMAREWMKSGLLHPDDYVSDMEILRIHDVDQEAAADEATSTAMSSLLTPPPDSKVFSAADPEALSARGNAVQDIFGDAEAGLNGFTGNQKKRTREAVVEVGHMDAMSDAAPELLGEDPDEMDIAGVVPLTQHIAATFHRSDEKTVKGIFDQALTDAPAWFRSSLFFDAEGGWLNGRSLASLRKMKTDGTISESELLGARKFYSTFRAMLRSRGTNPQTRAEAEAAAKRFEDQVKEAEKAAVAGERSVRQATGGGFGG